MEAQYLHIMRSDGLSWFTGLDEGNWHCSSHLMHKQLTKVGQHRVNASNGDAANAPSGPATRAAGAAPEPGRTLPDLAAIEGAPIILTDWNLNETPGLVKYGWME